VLKRYDFIRNVALTVAGIVAMSSEARRDAFLQGLRVRLREIAEDGLAAFCRIPAGAHSLDEF
jgi:hypothetical protein